MTNTKSWGGKLLNALLSLVLVMGLLPVMSPAKAYAEGGEDSQPGYLSGLSVKMVTIADETLASFDPATREYTIQVPSSETDVVVAAALSPDAPEGSTIVAKYSMKMFGMVMPLEVEVEDDITSYSSLMMCLEADEEGGSFEVEVGVEGDTQTYTVSIERCAAPELTLSATEATLAPGETLQLSASFPEGYPYTDVAWINESRSVVSVDENGLVTAVAPGTATVAAQHGYVRATCTVTVSPECSVSTVAAPAPEGLKVGDTFTVNVVATSKNLAAMQATLSFDASKLELVGVTKGAGLSEGASFIPEQGEAEAFFSFADNEASAAEGIVVATATFKVTAACDEAEIGISEGAIAARQGDPVEVPVAAGTFAKVSAIAAALLGDANNSGKVNIVDAQVVYDMATGKYGEDYAQLPLPESWTKATLLWVANVNGDDKIDAVDAFAIQRYVHYQTWE